MKITSCTCLTDILTPGDLVKISKSRGKYTIFFNLHNPLGPNEIKEYKKVTHCPICHKKLEGEGLPSGYYIPEVRDQRKNNESKITRAK